MSLHNWNNPEDGSYRANTRLHSPIKNSFTGSKGEQQFLHVAHYSDLIYMPTQNYKILKVH